MTDFLDIIRLMKRGDALEVRHRLNSGLDPNLSNEIGTTMLMLAAANGNTQIGALLIEGGAETDTENKMGMSALSLAAFRHPQFVRLLLGHGASVSRFHREGSLEHFLAWAEANCDMTGEEVSRLRDSHSL